MDHAIDLLKSSITKVYGPPERVKFPDFKKKSKSGILAQKLRKLSKSAQSRGTLGVTIFVRMARLEGQFYAITQRVEGMEGAEGTPLDMVNSDIKSGFFEI